MKPQLLIIVVFFLLLIACETPALININGTYVANHRNPSGTWVRNTMTLMRESSTKISGAGSSTAYTGTSRIEGNIFSSGGQIKINFTFTLFGASIHAQGIVSDKGNTITTEKYGTYYKQ